jgi:CRP/FNR family transcriptional regulator
MGTEVQYAERERLLEEGSDPERVCVVCRGMVKLSTSSPDGGMLLLRLAGPGDVLGLASVVKGTAYEATAEALEDCEVRVIPRREFVDFMNKFREVSWNSTETIAREYGSVVLSARRLALSGSATAKLARVLLDWGRTSAKGGADRSERSGKKVANSELRFRMPLTHEELGQMAGISRETTTRILGRLRREGLVVIDGERMLLRSPERLEKLYC